MPDENDLKKLITIHQHRLQKLREQQAVTGVNTDPAILMEIEDLKAEIKRLQADLPAGQRIAEPAEPPFALSEKATSGVKPTKPIDWGKVGAIATIVGIIVAIIIAVVQGWISLSSSPTPTPAGHPGFTYQVKVQARETGKDIANATVTLEIGGKAPLDGLTDSNGLARIFVDVSHAGQPGRLRIEAEGYIEHVQEIDITEGALPKQVLLERTH
jgi:hypothetical protein